jgi:signal transduction histidine kinase
VRSLFLKIFLWFWLAMVLVSLTLIISSLWSESRESRARDEAMDRTMTPLIADDIAEVYDRAGKQAFAAFLSRGKDSFPWQVYLFDPEGREALDRPASQQMRGLLSLAFISQGTEVLHQGNSRLVAQWVRTASGKPYVVVLALSHPPSPLFLPAPSQVQLLRFLIVLLIVGLVCFAITRHITSPILALRNASKQLAGGNLAARVTSLPPARRDALADLSHDFNHMAEQIQSLMSSQQRLIGDISHELRSPLARLGVALGLAQRSANPETSASLNRIERESYRLNEIISGLLQLSRVEATGENFRKQPVHLASLLEEVVSDADFEATSRNRSVRILESCASQFSGDPELIRSAVENVVRNAVNYTAEGTEVQVSLLRPQPDLALIRVRDHGPGVAESSLESIFEPFYRVEDSRDRATGGTGLGLSITERAVRAHGGSVRAHNDPSGGLVIELCLPITSPANTPLLP